MIQNVNNFVRDAGYSLNGVRQSALAYDAATARLETIHIGRTRILLVSNEAPFAWSYLPGSDLKSSLTYPNGLTASWTFDSNNQMLQVCNAAPTNVISQYDYTYDSAGRRVACGKSGSAFAQNDTLSYGYNEKSELTNAVAAVDSDYRYSYAFDDIGNRETSSERGTNSVYAANQLNQYTAVDDFTPEFDDDGNQTLVKTATGIWSVTYNGENRPTLWSCIQSNNSNNTNNQTILSMSYDRMGRRIEFIEAVISNAGMRAAQLIETNNHHRFVYDGYLCVQRLNVAENNAIDLIVTWDPAEPVSTRPLIIEKPGVGMLHVFHDGNKNVSDLVFVNGGSGVAAHYEYDPFGALMAATHDATSAVCDFRTYNPFRFSSEYADETLGLVYYNYRHYDPVMGRWMQRDPIFDKGGVNIYSMVGNAPYIRSDVLGLGWSGILSPSGGTLSYSEPMSQIVILNDFGGRLEMSTKGSATYTATTKPRAECVNGPDTPVKTSGEWNVKFWPPALSRKVVVSHGQLWQQTIRWTIEEYLVYTVIDMSLGIDGTRYTWSEEFCKCFKLTYGISAHGTAYVNNLGMATAAIAVTVAGEMVVVSVPAIIPTIEGIMEALSAKPIPIPAKPIPIPAM